MSRKKTKRKIQSSKARNSFRISPEPVVCFASNALEVAEPVGLPRTYGPPLLFAIARDPGIIFVSWNIDWPSVFERAMPVDRKVHLRVYRANNFEEKSVAVEPMATTHYVTISEPEGSYRLDIGYFRPAGVWHSIAISNEVLMPRNRIAEMGDVGLATIPFQLSFQELVESFCPGTNSALALSISRLENRAVNNGQEMLSAKERNALQKINFSSSKIEAARRSFEQTNCEKAARRSGALRAFGHTSPSGGFEATPACCGS